MEPKTSFDELLKDASVKKIFSTAYNFIFDTKTGRTWRWGEDIEDDPFIGPFPELADVAISNLCDRGCEFCYRDSKPDGPIMSLEDFETVLKELPMTFQLAVGGGEPTMHPQFIKILKKAHEYGKVVNYTTNGRYLTDEMIEATKKYCGAVAVSFREDDDLWLKTIRRFIDAGMKTNIHLVVSELTYKYGIDIVKDIASGNKKYGLDGLHAIVFLLYKPIGRADIKHILTDESAAHFLKEVFNYGTMIGFDSCFVGHIKKAYDAGDITLDWRMIDSCESSRFSVFIDESLNVKPCSFSSDSEYTWNLKDKSFKDIWMSEKFEKFRDMLRDDCFGCPLLR